MAKTLSLKEMTLHEKLAAMELLWDDLARCPESVESPSWHKDVLDERHQRIADGEGHFTAWETAKTEIRKKIL
jgi:Putative addiction module component